MRAARILGNHDRASRAQSRDRLCQNMGDLTALCNAGDIGQFTELADDQRIDTAIKRLKEIG